MTVWDWLHQNLATVTALANIAMVLIWLLYLQVFLVSYRRQRSASLHLDLGAATNEEARCIVANMGQETVYLAAIVVDLFFADGRYRALATDRDEMPSENAQRPLEKTNKGPLKNGDVRDIGSFVEIAQRTNIRRGIEVPFEELSAIEVTVIAASHQGHALVGASKKFNVTHTEDRRTFAPDTLLTAQIRSWWRERKLLALLNEN